MNSSKEDLGVLLDYEMDMAFGSGENDFEAKLQAESHCCKEGYFLYMEGTEYGGIVDNIMSDTANNEVVYSGRTWHGILGSKVIMPLQDGEATDEEEGVTQDGTTLTVESGILVTQSGHTLNISSMLVTVVGKDSSGDSLVDRYLVISGDANACIQFIIDRCGLGDLFTTASTTGGTVDRYQFNRFIDAYSGIYKMLKSAGLVLRISFSGGKAVLSAIPQHDYSQDEEFDSDLMEFKLKKKYKTVNHLICLGTGELENRTVIHLYADINGNISQEQTQFGMDEYTAVYDYSAVESEEELISGGTDYLKTLWGQDELSVAFDDTTDSYNIGDKVGAVENITGLAIAAIITKKIVTIKNGQTTISYEVGE